MSKRHVSELISVWECLVKDTLVRYPALRDELSFDFARLQFLVKQRGFSLFATDLPALGKHLDKCLACGKYTPSNLPLSRVVSKAIQIPKFLRGMYLLIFHSNGCLKEDCEHEAIFFLRQLLYVGKKVSLPCPESAVQQEVVDFALIDSGLPDPSDYWCLAAPDRLSRRRASCSFSERYLGDSEFESARLENSPSGRVDDLLRTLDFVSSVLTSTLGPYRFEDWKFRHGPGAISDHIGPTNKYCWTSWTDRLERVFPIADCGFHNYCAWAGNTDSLVSSDEPYSRLIAVRKTYTKPRLIAAEPREHQWCQQNCWDYFATRTRTSWISDFVSFRDQSLNQDLCVEASRTGNLATVDLSSASDRLTPGVVGSFFRGNPPLLDALQASRTRYLRQTICKDVPSLIQLRKFSTMGSACTFPVQSLVFLGIALSAALVRARLEPTVRNIRLLRGKVAVFGDDIIVPVDSREDLTTLLEVLHFKINEGKTYSDGNFRESCGVDAFRGHCVTPIYWKGEVSSDPTAIASRIECANNFYSKFLLHTRALVASTIPKGFPYVGMQSDVAGLKSRVPVQTGPVRLNRHLQRYETRVLSCCGRVRRSPTNDDTSLHQFFTEEPDPTDEWVHGVAGYPDIRVKGRWVPVDSLVSN